MWNNIPPAVLGAAIGAIVTLTAVFLTSYLSGRSEVDKKLVEIRIKLLDDMIAAIVTGKLDADLDARARAALPRLYRSWREYWHQRVTSEIVPLERDYKGKSLMTQLEREMRRPIPGTLRKQYGSVATFISVALLVESLRVAGLAYPDFAERHQTTFLYDMVAPLPFEYELAESLYSWGVDYLFK